MKCLGWSGPRGVGLAGTLAAACLWTASAQAGFVLTPSGSGLVATDMYLAQPGSTASSPIYSSSPPGTDYLLAVPGDYSFSDSFAAQPPTQVMGTDSIAGSYAFQDSYVFQVGAGASGDTLVATLNLGTSFGMSDLQARLYQITSGTTTPVVGGQVVSGQSPVVHVLSLWQGQGAPGLDTQPFQVDFSGLTTAGTYVLDIAGTATGSNGGLYIGALELQPVPLPESTWLLLSGIAALTLAARRRGATA
jgi:hypothetical protein